jgi:uncharacterized delta-60 repeat protein
MVTGPSIKVFNVANGVAIQPDGKIVISGYCRDNVGPDVFAVLRFNANGTLDAGFGTGGFLTTSFFGQDDFGVSLLLQTDGRIVVTGTASDAQGGGNFGLVRYSADGTLDSTFGSGGKVITAFTGGHASGPRAPLQADGKIVLAGNFVPTGTRTAAVALTRHNSDGSLDTSFGTAGRTTTSIFGFFEAATAVAIQPDGNIVVAAETQKTQDGNSLEFAALRYLGGSAPFSLALAQPSVTGDRGAKVKVTFSINRAAGFSGNVTITPPDSAQGVKFKPPDPITTTDASVAFKLKIAATAPTGPQQLTFTGKSDDGQVSTATLTLNIQ